MYIYIYISRPFLNQSEVKPNQSWLPCTRFPRRARWMWHTFASSSDSIILLFTSAVIGQSNCFGFSFSGFNWKPPIVFTLTNNTTWKTEWMEIRQSELTNVTSLTCCTNLHVLRLRYLDWGYVKQTVLSS